MPPDKAIVKLAVPATLAPLAKVVYNLVDTAYIGMLGSDIALTAVGIPPIPYSKTSTGGGVGPTHLRGNKQPLSARGHSGRRVLYRRRRCGSRGWTGLSDPCSRGGSPGL